MSLGTGLALNFLRIVEAETNRIWGKVVMEKAVILAKLRDYVDRQITLHELEEWVLGHLQMALDSDNAETVDLIDVIDVLLMRLADGDVCESGFFAEICGIVDSALDITFSFAGEFVTKIEELPPHRVEPTSQVPDSVILSFG